MRAIAAGFSQAWAAGEGVFGDCIGSGRGRRRAGMMVSRTAGGISRRRRGHDMNITPIHGTVANAGGKRSPRRIESRRPRPRGGVPR